MGSQGLSLRSEHGSPSSHSAASHPASGRSESGSGEESEDSQGEGYDETAVHGADACHEDPDSSEAEEFNSVNGETGEKAEDFIGDAKLGTSDCQGSDIADGPRESDREV